MEKRNLIFYNNPGQNYMDTLAVYDLFTYYLTFPRFLPEYTQPPLPLDNVDLKAVLLASLH